MVAGSNPVAGTNAVRSGASSTRRVARLTAGGFGGKSLMIDFWAPLDDFLSEWAFWPQLPLLAAAAGFCHFDHYSPWSRVFLALFTAFSIGCIALRGIWRLNLRLVPLVAIGLVTFGCLAVITQPMGIELSWAVFERFVSPPSLVPAGIELAVVFAAFVVGILLWYGLTEAKPPVRDSAATGAKRTGPVPD